jgi:hypothetical protein
VAKQGYGWKSIVRWVAKHGDGCLSREIDGEQSREMGG